MYPLGVVAYAQGLRERESECVDLNRCREKERNRDRKERKREKKREEERETERNRENEKERERKKEKERERERERAMGRERKRARNRGTEGVFPYLFFDIRDCLEKTYVTVIVDQCTDMCCLRNCLLGRGCLHSLKDQSYSETVVSNPVKLNQERITRQRSA